MNRRIVAVWWIACLLWSAGWLFIKIGVQDLPPLTFAAMRLVLASLLLVPLTLRNNEWRQLTSRDLVTVALSGLLLLGINYALVFWGAQYVASGLTSLLQATSPVFSFGFGILLGLERATLARTAAIALGLVGVAIVSGVHTGTAQVAALASLAIVAGAVCVAAAYAIVKVRGTHLSPLTLTTGQTLAALGPLIVLAFAFEYDAPLRWAPPAVVALLYLGLVNSVLAFWLNNWLVRHMEPTAILSMMLVQPLIAAILGWLVIGERLTANIAIGGACILIGAAVILRPKLPMQPN